MNIIWSWTTFLKATSSTGFKWLQTSLLGYSLGKKNSHWAVHIIRRTATLSDRFLSSYRKGNSTETAVLPNEILLQASSGQTSVFVLFGLKVALDSFWFQLNVTDLVRYSDIVAYQVSFIYFIYHLGRVSKILTVSQTGKLWGSFYFHVMVLQTHKFWQNVVTLCKM